MAGVLSIAGADPDVDGIQFQDGPQKIPVWIVEQIGEEYFKNADNLAVLQTLPFTEFQQACLQMDTERRLREMCLSKIGKSGKGLI